MIINTNKSNIVHFRPATTRIPKYDVILSCNNHIMNVFDNYTYFGFVLHEQLYYNITAKAVASLEKRELGLVTAKCKF